MAHPKEVSDTLICNLRDWLLTDRIDLQVWIEDDDRKAVLLCEV